MSRFRLALAFGLALGMLFAVPVFGGSSATDGKSDSSASPVTLKYGQGTVRTSEHRWQRLFLTVAPAQSGGDPSEHWTISAPSGCFQPKPIGGSVREPVKRTLEKLVGWLSDPQHKAGLYVSFGGTREKPQAVGSITFTAPRPGLTEPSDTDLFYELAAAGAGIDVYVRDAAGPCSGKAVTLCDATSGQPIFSRTASWTTGSDGYCFIGFRDCPDALTGGYVIECAGLRSDEFCLTPPQLRTARYHVALNLAQPGSKRPVTALTQIKEEDWQPPDIPDLTAFRQKAQFRTGVGVRTSSFAAWGDVGALLALDLAVKKTEVDPRPEGTLTIEAQVKHVYCEGGTSDFVEITAEGTVARDSAIDIAGREPPTGISIGMLARSGDNPGGLGLYYVASPSWDLRAHLIYAFISDDETQGNSVLFGLSLGLDKFTQFFPKAY